MKIKLLILQLILANLLFGQNCNIDLQQNFQKLKKEIDSIRITHASDKDPRNFGFKETQIHTADSSLNFQLKNIVLDNPFDSSYPISYSVLYKNYLITLFEKGTFVCHNIDNFNRDLDFENKINKYSFQYQWIYDNKLTVISNGKYYVLNENNEWTDFIGNFPIINKPILHEDDEYLIFRDYYGEWGGTLYFFQKRTGFYFFTEASQAISIIKNKSEYNVLISSFNTRLKEKSITNPSKLSVTSKKESHGGLQGQALGYQDTSQNSISYLTKNEVLGFSKFKINDKEYYIINNDKTFIADFNNGVFRMVHPLFNNDLFTHHPITRNYNGRILINLDFYGEGRDREISNLLIIDNKIVKIDWNKINCR